MFMKIIKDNKIIDISEAFVKWDPKINFMINCNINEAQYVLSYDGLTFYHDYWLRVLPDNFPHPILAEIKEITEQEYNELLELLDNNEDIAELQYEEQQNLQEDNLLYIMTINEMREKILEQENLIKILTNYILQID